MASPMKQFEVAKTSGEEFTGALDLAFTNAAMSMAIAAGLAILVMGLASMSRSVVPGKMQAIGEMLYDMVAGMVKENVGSAGRAYFPFFMTLFLFILFSNVIGMNPFFFTNTSHIAVTFFMSMFIFIGVTVIGLVRHGTKFFSLFLPHGTPLFVAPIVIPIEIISYLSRPISLAVRLFANMVVGHVIMKVVAGFVFDLFVVGGVLVALGLVAFAFLIPITALEFLVAGLQAYIFTVLATIYLHDAIHLH